MVQYLDTDLGELPAKGLRGKAAEQAYYAEIISELKTSNASMTSFMERFQGRLLNHVLEVATAVFDASGMVTRSYQSPIGSLEVENLGSTSSANSAAVVSSTAFNNQSVGASGTADSTSTIDGSNVSQARVLITASGADVSITLQGSTDNVNWFAVTPAYTAGATGWQAAVDIPGLFLRLHAANAGVGAETVTAKIVYKKVDLSVAAASHGITVSSANPSSAPTIGVGVYIVPAGQRRVVSIGSTAFTLYGAPGDTVSFQAFTSGAQPGV